MTPQDRQRRRWPGFDDDRSRSCGGKTLNRPRVAPMAGCGRGRVSPPTARQGVVRARNTRGARRRQLLSRATAAAAASVPRAPSAPSNVPPLPQPPTPPTLSSTYSRRRRHRCSSCSVHRTGRQHVHHPHTHTVGTIVDRRQHTVILL